MNIINEYIKETLYYDELNENDEVMYLGLSGACGWDKEVCTVGKMYEISSDIFACGLECDNENCIDRYRFTIKISQGTRLNNPAQVHTFSCHLTLGNRRGQKLLNRKVLNR